MNIIIENNCNIKTELNEKINLWVFWYCSCVWESSIFPMSYHKTRKGAMEAMKSHKLEEKKEFDEMEARLSEGNPKYKSGLKFGRNKKWQVEKFELEILP